MATPLRARGWHSLAWRGLVLMLVLVQVAWQPVQKAVAAPELSQAKPISLHSSPVRSLFDEPQASTTLNLPATALLGQQVAFTVTFQNPASSGVGYGPFIDLIIPASQGLGTTIITASYQGISLALGTNLFIATFDASGHATHPLARDMNGNYIVVDGDPGDKLVTIKLPFGSYSPGQPPISVDVSVNMAAPPAQVGTPIPVSVRGGYQFGATPLDDWCCDLVVNTISDWASSSVTPELSTLSKSYSGPENEAVSGPNFRALYPMKYTVAVDIAPGQTIANLVLSDVLPDNLQPVNWVNQDGGTCSPDPLNTAAPGDTIECTFASASGHMQFIFDSYIPLTNGGGNPAINPVTGAAVISCNNASASGTWNSTPVSTSTGTPPACGHTLNDRSIAIQKSAGVVGGGIPEPGVLIKNTLNFQVSDFFAFDNVTILDIISDGLHFYPGNSPTMQINGNSYTLPVSTIDSANYDVDCYYGNPGGPECTHSSNPSDSGNPDQFGTTQLTFFVSQEIQTATGNAQNGKLIGGCVNPAGGSSTPDCGTYNDGPTTGQIVFYTQVLNNFVDNYPSGDPSVDQGDRLTNTGKYIRGDVLDTGTLQPTATPPNQPQDELGCQPQRSNGKANEIRVRSQRQYLPVIPGPHQPRR